ncbi:hypothetical protein TNCV_3239841 [Trichonephila clavipes]|nr:hypothetical protein TNCV_3239841 [Trichonephila clavipes]
MGIRGTHCPMAMGSPDTHCPKPGNIPLEKSDHFCPDAVTSLLSYSSIVLPKQKYAIYKAYVSSLKTPRSKCLIATPSLHVPTTNQVVPSPPRTATPSGTINNYDMGWRLALRAICLATDSNSD